MCWFYSSHRASRGPTAAQDWSRALELGFWDPCLPPTSQAGRGRHLTAALHHAAMGTRIELWGRTDARPPRAAVLDGCSQPHWLSHMFGDKSHYQPLLHACCGLTNAFMWLVLKSFWVGRDKGNAAICRAGFSLKLCAGAAPCLHHACSTLHSAALGTCFTALGSLWCW